MPLAGGRKENVMTQTERLTFLINYLQSENNELKSIDIPAQDTARKRLLRSLMNNARKKVLFHYQIFHWHNREFIYGRAILPVCP